jgi:flagellar biosynthesis/type III secretory pathway protein FliH
MNNYDKNILLSVLEQFLEDRFNCTDKLIIHNLYQILEKEIEELNIEWNSHYYDDGYDDGYADGYDDGKSEGLSQGFTEGENSGIDEGFDSGYEQALKDYNIEED